MIFIKTILFVKDHKLPAWLDKKLAEVLEQQEGKRILLTIETEKKTRSSAENRFYWGVILPLIHNALIDWGNNVTRAETHEYLKIHVGKLIKDIHDDSGEVKPICRSSADLTTKEWEDWCENIRIWATPLGIQVPYPHELTYREGLTYDDMPI